MTNKTKEKLIEFLSLGPEEVSQQLVDEYPKLNNKRDKLSIHIGVAKTKTLCLQIIRDGGNELIKALDGPHRTTDN